MLMHDWDCISFINDDMKYIYHVCGIFVQMLLSDVIVIEYFDLDILFVISFLRIRLFLIKYNDHCDKYQYLLSIILKIKNEFKNHLLIGCMRSHFWSYFPLKICEKTCQQNIQ